MSEPKRQPPRLIEVRERRQLSPHVARIVFAGEQLAGFGPAWPAAHIKLFFPRAHQRVPVLPTLSAEGRPLWPAPADKPVVRTYSVRAHDVERGTLTVDFVVHEPEGPASRWAREAHPGMKLGLAGPGGPRPMLKSADWYLLAGDLSALPAIEALLEVAPADAPVRVFLRVEHAADVRDLRAPGHASIQWLVSQPTSAFVDLVATGAACGGTPQVWLAGENAQVVGLRDALLARYPEARPTAYAVPYWKRRESEEQYHEERHRIMDELALP